MRLNFYQRGRTVTERAESVLDEMSQAAQIVAISAGLVAIVAITALLFSTAALVEGRA